MQKIAYLSLVLIAAALLLGYSTYEASQEQVSADLECGFTTHFANFLSANGYDKWKFDRPDLKCAAYGGKANNKDTIKKVPVIFIHGNSDLAFGRGSADGYVSWQTGFRSLATFLSNQGYQKSEMYTTTWGPADPNQAQSNFHSKEYVTRMRAFV